MLGETSSWAGAQLAILFLSSRSSISTLHHLLLFLKAVCREGDGPMVTGEENVGGDDIEE